ncbi:MAG: FkbM family methyltransferase [Desulfobacter sp.]|nr:FkbM family methyltransferase [Desulfobacter sp.]
MFDALSIDLVLDVGANNGGYGTMLRQMGYKGHIISFEPVKRCYKALQETIGNDKKWIAHNFALGPEDKVLTINVPRSNDFASFLDVTDGAKEIWATDFSAMAQEQVQVKALDQVFEFLVRDLGEKRNIFLKMDTQGFDLEVFKGAEQSIQNIQGIQSEISVIPIYENMPDYIESLSCFRENGFELTGLYPVSRNMQTLLVVEFDAVMIKQP